MIQSVDTNQIRSIPSENRDSSDKSKYGDVVKIFVIAMLGAITAVGIGLPITIYASNSLSTTTATTSTTRMPNTTTSTTATTTTVTTTTASTTSTSTTRTTSTTSVTTTTTSTATTTLPFCPVPCLCGGVSPYTLWQIYSTAGLFMDVNTSNCRFDRTPSYYTSIYGTSDHWQITGHSAIYSAASATFRVYIRNVAGWSASTMLSNAASFRWNVSWVGMYS